MGEVDRKEHRDETDYYRNVVVCYSIADVWHTLGGFSASVSAIIILFLPYALVLEKV